MSNTISSMFKKIPSNTIASGSAIEIQERSLRTTSSLIQRMLIMGYCDEATVITDELRKIRRWDSPEDVAFTFGQRSHITQLFNRAYNTSKGNYEIYIQILENKTPATEKPQKMTISITGTPTSNGYIYVYLNNEPIEVEIVSGTDKDDIINAIILAINSKNIPFDATIITAAEIGTITGTQPTDGTEKNVLITTNYSGEIANENKLFINPFESERKKAPAGIVISTLDDLEVGIGKPDFDKIAIDIYDTEIWFTVIAFPITNEDTIKTSSSLFVRRSDVFDNKIFQGIFAKTNPSYSEYKTFIETSKNGKPINDPAVNIGWLKDSMTCESCLCVEIASQVALINCLTIGRGYRNTKINALQKENTNQPKYVELNNLAIIGGGYLIKNEIGDIVIDDLWCTYRKDSMGNSTKLEFAARDIALDIAKLNSIKEVQNSEEFKNAIFVSEDTMANQSYVKKASDVRSAMITVILSLWKNNNWCFNVNATAKSVRAELDTQNKGRVNLIIEDESSYVGRFNAAILVKLTQ